MPPKLPPKMPAPANKPRKRKQFKIEAWTGEGEGEKIIVYGVTKMGKTTLAALAPDSVFIGADDGGRKIKHPVTGEHLNYVSGIESFEDVRDALHSNVFDNAGTIVTDTITFVGQWGLTHTLANIPKPKSQGGGTANNIHDYGYHEGFNHWCDTMLLLLQDFDRWVRKGKNVILLAQETTHKWKTSNVEDFLMAGPELHHSRTASIMLPYVEWADHVFRVAYANRMVDEHGKVNPVQERAIYVHPDATFFAGSRTISSEYPIVEFKDKTDDSIWRLVFDGN